MRFFTLVAGFHMYEVKIKADFSAAHNLREVGENANPFMVTTSPLRWRCSPSRWMREGWSSISAS